MKDLIANKDYFRYNNEKFLDAKKNQIELANRN